MANRPDLYAAKSREEIELAIKGGAKVNKARDFAETPFQFHCRQGNAEAVRTLLENGADLEMPVAKADAFGDRTGWRPLDLAMEHRLMDLPSQRKECVKILLDAGVSLERGPLEKPLIQRAIERRDTQVIDRMLDVYGADGVSAMRCSGDKTVLEHAARWDANRENSNAPTMLGYLLEQGIDPNTISRSGEPALMTVGNTGVNTLLDHGADPNLTNAHGETALHRLCAKDELGVSPITVDAVQALVDYGAKVDAVDHMGNTPLAKAARNDLAPIANVLMRSGADPHLAASCPAIVDAPQENRTIALVRGAAVEQEKRTLRLAAAEATHEQEQAPAPRKIRQRM